MSELKSYLVDLLAYAESVRKNCADEARVIKEQIEAEMSELIAGHAAEISSLKQRHAEAILAIGSKHAGLLDDLKAKHAEEDADYVAALKALPASILPEMSTSSVSSAPAADADAAEPHDAAQTAP